MANNFYKIYATSNNQWEELELDNLDLNTVFSVEEINDISQRKDNITKTIVLKGTKKNNQVFGALYSIDRDVSKDVNSTNLLYNYKPNKYVDCFVLENNVEIIRGKLLVTSIDINRGTIFYNCSIVGSVYSFFSQLSDRKLQDLDSFNIVPYNEITYNKENITASWKLPHIEGGFNLINRRETTLGGVVWTDGLINTTQAYSSYSAYTPFIKIKPSTEYTLRKSTNPEADKFIRLAFYDSGFNMINRFTSNNIETDFSVLAPANAVYVRLSFPNSVVNIKMEEGVAFTGYSDNPEDKLPYTFPMIDYGGGGFTEAQMWDANYDYWRYDVYRPAIYVKSYLDAIFRGFRINNNGRATQKATDTDGDDSLLANFKWNASFKASEEFNKLIIPHNEPTLSKKITPEQVGNGGILLLGRVSGSVPGSNAGPGSTDGNLFRPLPAYTGEILQTDYITTGLGWFNGKSNHRYFSPTQTYSGRVLFTGTLSVSRFLTAQSVVKVVLVKVPIGQTFFYNSDIIEESNVVFTGGNNSASFEVLYEGELSEGYSYVVTAIADNAPAQYEDWGFSNTTLQVRVSESLRLNSILRFGEQFNLFNMIPVDIDIREFLKNLMLLFNWYIIADPNDDSLFHIYTYNEFYDRVLVLDKDSAVDWTKKIDWNSYSINTNIDLPRGYEYSYKEDKDALNKLYTELNGEIYGEKKLLDSSGLVASKRTEIMFSPTVNSNWKDRIDTPTIYEGTYFEGERKQFKSNIRILYFNGEVSVPYENFYSLLLDSGGVNQEIFFSYGHASMACREVERLEDGRYIMLLGIKETLFFDVPLQSWSTDLVYLSNFPQYRSTQYLYDRYYENQIKELTDVNLMVIEAEAYLNEVDISNLDFRKPIYLQSPYGSAYFKLLRVEYSDANRTSRIRLQKIVLPDTNVV